MSIVILISILILFPLIVVFYKIWEFNRTKSCKAAFKLAIEDDKVNSIISKKDIKFYLGIGSPGFRENEEGFVFMIFGKGLKIIYVDIDIKKNDKLEFEKVSLFAIKFPFRPSDVKK